MYSNGGGLAAKSREICQEKPWRFDDTDGKAFRNGKRFVQCICPKCTDHHSVYMLWAGRGVPRKYCGICKPLISGYDDAALYESAVYAPGHSKKKGRRNEGE